MPPKQRSDIHPHSPSGACTKVVTLLMCWLVAVTFMLAEPALALGCDQSNGENKRLDECDLVGCTGLL